MTWLMVLKGDRFKEKRPRHHSSVNPNKTFLCIHVVVNFFILGIIFLFPLFQLH